MAISCTITGAFYSLNGTAVPNIKVYVRPDHRDNPESIPDSPGFGTTDKYGVLKTRTYNSGGTPVDVDGFTFSSPRSGYPHLIEYTDMLGHLHMLEFKSVEGELDISQMALYRP